MPLIPTSPNRTGCCAEATGANAAARLACRSCCAEPSGSSGPSFEALLRDAGEARDANAQRRDVRAPAAPLSVTAESTAARTVARTAPTEA